MNQEDNSEAKTKDLIDQIAEALKEARLDPSTADGSKLDADVDSKDIPAAEIEAEPGSDLSQTSAGLSLREIHSIPSDRTGSSAEESVFRNSPLFLIPGYKFLREIGRGGQAAVFEAVQLSTGQKVAVKLLRDGAISTPHDLARFDREIRILAALNHPNIVHVIDGGHTLHGGHYLVMAFVQGISLDAWLKNFRAANRGKRTPDQLNRLLLLFLKICDAVNAAHLRGVVHRDLKPSNLIVDERGEPHILDFGLARTAVNPVNDSDTPAFVSATGQFVGSLPWASPEQARGIHSQIDMRTDVYSLGVILYQMISGNFPYEVTGSMPDVMNNILSQNPQAPSKRESKSNGPPVQADFRHPSISSLFLRRTSVQVLDAIVLKALAKRPEDRYLSAGEMARDITNLLSDRPTLAAGDPARWRRLTRKAMAPISLVAIALLAFTIGSLVGRVSFHTFPETTQAFFSPTSISTRSSVMIVSPPDSPPVAGEKSDGVSFSPPLDAATTSQIVIGIASERTKIEWLRQAINEFKKTPEGTGIEVRLFPMSGTASIRAIIDGDQRINATMPSNSYLIDVFTENWKSLYGKTPVLRIERLALSPLVFLFTQSSYDSFTKDHPQASFKAIHDLLQSPDSAIRSSAFKFGYANPIESLDGDAGLVLMDYEFSGKTRNLTIQDAQSPEFRTFLQAFTTDSNCIANNPISLVQDMVLMGGRRFDCILAPENAIVSHLDVSPGKIDALHLVYPQWNVWNDHPAYILDVPWTTDAQKKAAAQFVDYLISEPAQKLALASGLRPINLNVPLNAPNSPFVRYADHGIRLELTRFYDPPSTRVMQGLQATWVQARPSGQLQDHPPSH